MKEKFNKKKQHELFTLFTIYTSNIVGRQINSSTIAYLFIYSASNITYLSGHGQRLIHCCSASK